MKSSGAVSQLVEHPLMLNNISREDLDCLIQYLQQEMRDQKQMIQFRMLVKFLFLLHQKAEFSLKSLISRVLEKKL